MLNFIFGSSITRKAQRHKKIEGDIEVLKKQQKVKCETLLKKCEQEKAVSNNNTRSQIAALTALINSAKKQNETKLSRLDQELKISIDKIINQYDLMIIKKKNEATRLQNLIKAERDSEEAALQSDLPNSPRVRLVEHKNK